MRQVAYSATMKRRFFLVALCAAGVWSAGAAFAHDRPGRNDDDALERVRRAREQGRILPLETIVAQAERDLDAKVVDVEIEDGHRDVEFIYEVKLLAADGHVIVAIYDAATGRQLKVRGHNKHR